MFSSLNIVNAKLIVFKSIFVFVIKNQVLFLKTFLHKYQPDQVEWFCIQNKTNKFKKNLKIFL